MEYRWFVDKKFQSEEYRCENDEKTMGKFNLMNTDVKTMKSMGKINLRGNVKTMKRLWENLIRGEAM